MTFEKTPHLRENEKTARLCFEWERDAQVSQLLGVHAGGAEGRAAGGDKELTGAPAPFPQQRSGVVVVVDVVVVLRE